MHHMFQLHASCWKSWPSPHSHTCSVNRLTHAYVLEASKQQVLSFCSLPAELHLTFDKHPVWGGEVRRQLERLHLTVAAALISWQVSEELSQLSAVMMSHFHSTRLELGVVTRVVGHFLLRFCSWQIASIWHWWQFPHGGGAENNGPDLDVGIVSSSAVFQANVEVDHFIESTRKDFRISCSQYNLTTFYYKKFRHLCITSPKYLHFLPVVDIFSPLYSSWVFKVSDFVQEELR